MEKAEAKLKELGYEDYNVFETTIIVDFPEQIKWYKATFSSRTQRTELSTSSGGGREWYVYVFPVEDIPVGTVLSGYETHGEALTEAERVRREIPSWKDFIAVFHRSDERIKEYAKTHPAWAKREGFASTSSGEQEVREGDVGTLTKFRVWFTTPIGFERFVDVDAIDEGEAKRLAEKQVPAGSEFRGAFRKRGAASQISGQVEVYPEVREGDVGTLTESLMADDTAGRSRRIPAGMEVKVSVVSSRWISFVTGEVIEGENVFVALPLEFRRKFRKRSEGERVEGVAIRILELLKEKGPMTEYEISTELGVPPERVGETTDILMGESKIEREIPTGVYKLPPLTCHDCPVCGDPVAGGPDEYLEHIKTKHPEEWRKLETDPSYSLRRAEAGPRQLVPIVRRLPTVTIRGKKYYLDARLREYRAVDDPHDRIPLEPEYAKLLGEASVGSVAWNAVVESIIEEKQREARREALPW
ncbi:hypothetical protein ES703_75759 [subsurface metagenome]